MTPGLWRLLAGAGALVLAGFLLILFGNARYHSGQLAERGIWQAKTSLAQISDQEHAAKVETRQAVIQQEQSDDLKAKLADALARAAARPPRLCHSAQSGGGVQSVPEPANASSGAPGPSEEAIVAADDAACAEGVIKAQGWRDWWLAVSAVPR